MERTAKQEKGGNRTDWQTSRKERVSYYIGPGGAKGGRYKLNKNQVEIMTACNDGTITCEDAEAELQASGK